MAEGGALMMISILWRLTTLGGRAFSQPEGLFEWVKLFEDDPGIKQTQGMQEEIHFDNVSCQYISTSSGHND